MSGWNYMDLTRMAAPEIIVLLTAVVVVAVDLGVSSRPHRFRILVCAVLATLGCLAAVAWMVMVPEPARTGNWDMFETSPLTQTVKGLLLALTIMSVWLMQGSRVSRHIGEYTCLLLLSVSGMMLLVSSRDMITVFVSLELSTIPLYAVAGFYKDSRAVVQSALRYYLLGATASAMTLFGFSLLYGGCGSVRLQDLWQELGAAHPDTLILAGAVLVIAGTGFKVAAAPFHLWAPEIYQTAPLPAAAFIGSASKVAGFFILAVLFVLGPVGGSGAFTTWRGTGWPLAVLAVSGFSLVLGTLGALAQSDLRRLLAFSAIAHAGYILMALLASKAPAFSALSYYTATYGVATLGAFAVIALADGDRSGCRTASLAGLGSANSVLSACMLVFMLSLAGIPPLAGFSGKFLIFTAFIKAGPLDPIRLMLLFLALAASAVSLYYYLRVLKSVYVKTPEPRNLFRPVPLGQMLLVSFAAAGLVALGIAPQLLLRLME